MIKNVSDHTLHITTMIVVLFESWSRLIQREILHGIVPMIVGLNHIIEAKSMLKIASKEVARDEIGLEMLIEIREIVKTRLARIKGTSNNLNDIRDFEARVQSEIMTEKKIQISGTMSCNRSRSE